jgi:hypothetical protein
VRHRLTAHRNFEEFEKYLDDEVKVADIIELKICNTMPLWEKFRVRPREVVLTIDTNEEITETEEDSGNPEDSDESVGESMYGMFFYYYFLLLLNPIPALTPI